ncbi:hypothetical protein CEE39_09540 [bacterium (candidate division B38) B3_B38]|nr:MAG: hypothetical protein CEE39_09540 [bacterium (candidate division B38) B3_B38]
MARCYCCGYEFEEGYRPSREDYCPQCSSEVHCCLNCQFYSEHAHNKCLEPTAEWVADREKANFCGYFTLGSREGKSEKRSKPQDEARVHWESLWKKDKPS